MKKSSPNIDGVVHRQRRRNIGDFKDTKELSRLDTVINQQKEQVAKNKTAGFKQVDEPPAERISMSLDEINLSVDDETSQKKPQGLRAKWQNRKEKKSRRKARRSKWNRRVRLFAKIGGAVGVIIVGFIIFKGWFALQRIIVDRDGGGSPVLNSEVPLNGEGDGRINIMLLGIGGEGHTGGNLADTIIIASIDPFAKEVAMLSVPRDMYVDVPGYWSMRINAAHAVGIDQNHPGGGPALIKETIEATLDIPIHYFARVDFTGFVQAIDTVGGIDLFIEEAVYDTHFAAGGYILDVPEGWQYFDGERALFYARSRYTSSRGDFDRNDRQRLIIQELSKKVFSLGTFSDPRKITSLADTAGDHVRTDIQVSEMLRLYDIVKDVPSSNFASYGLTNAADNYLASSNIGGAAVLVPKAGDYSEVQRFVRELFVDGFIRSEAAEIAMFDGSGIGAGITKADELRSYGYNLTETGNFDGLSENTVIYDNSNDSAPFTKRYLEQRFGVTMVSSNELPESITSEAAFVIVLGANGDQGF